MHCWTENSLFCELGSGSVVKDKPVIIHEKALFMSAVKKKTREKIKLYGQVCAYQQTNLKIQIIFLLL